MPEVFHSYEKNTELVTELNFETSEIITEKGKAYSYGKFIKNYFKLITRRVFPKKKCILEQLRLSRFTMARRIDDLSKNVELSLKQKISKCSAITIALGESTGVSDTAQLVFQLSH